MKIDVSSANIDFFRCLSSEKRLEIIDILRNTPKNIGELASLLNVSSTIITRHISMLEASGIIHTENVPGKRGLQKKCYLSIDEVTLNFLHNFSINNNEITTLSIPVGHYSDYNITPTCGLSSTSSMIGLQDDPRYFSNPERVNASILWFQTGYIEYMIPSYILTKDINSFEISLEICSEYPGYKCDYPSDIYFYINGVLLGMWISPGDFGDKQGIYTPDWHVGTQYGLLKTLKVTPHGTYIDGLKVSNTTLDDLSLKSNEDICFKISSPKDTKNPGGVTLFGSNFGNYNQDIVVKIESN